MHLHVLAQRGQHRCDLNYLGQLVPRQGTELLLTSAVAADLARKRLSSGSLQQQFIKCSTPGLVVHKTERKRDK